MSILTSEDVLWVILVLGIINFIAVVLLYFSCRCLPGLSRRLKNRSFAGFYKLHCYIWWILLPSVTIHAVLATLRFFILT